jgi:hypothetical protein
MTLRHALYGERPSPPGSNATKLKKKVQLYHRLKSKTIVAAKFKPAPDDSFLTWKIIGLKGLRDLTDQYRCVITFHQNPQQRLNILIKMVLNLKWHAPKIGGSYARS